MEGNQSRDFLKKTGKLEEAFFRAGLSVMVKGLPFIASLRSFSLVIDQCFQVELKEGTRIASGCLRGSTGSWGLL